MKKNVEPFDFYLTATLANLRGVLDYLLEEYNAKYSVGIADHEDLNGSIFKERARRGKNRNAELFIDSYIEGKKKLLADPRCEKLLARHGSRDIIIHRRQPTKKVSITVYDQITSSFHIEVKDEKGNIVSAADSPPQSVTARPSEVRYFLQDWTKDDIPTLCEYVLDELKEFVCGIRRSFP